MSNNAKLKYGLLCATMLTASLTAVPAYAADEAAAEAEAAAAESASSADASDVIIVSGTRRDVSITRSPINIAAVGAATLQEERINDVKDLGAFTPGITVGATGPRGSGSIVMRGLSANGTGVSGLNFDNSLGTYLGEVPLYLDFKLIDIERVETLLGPQGTLYGLGTLAGAIRYIPGRPDASGFSGSAHGRLYDVAHSDGVGYVGDVTLNIPIVQDVLAFRTATGYYYDPGFIDYPYVVREPGVSLPQPGGVDNPLGSTDDRQLNFNPHKDVNWERTFTTRNQLGLTIPGFTAYASYVFQQTRTDGSQSNTHSVLGEGRYENASRYLEPSNRKSHLASLEMELEIGDIMEVVSATAFTKTIGHSVGDVTDLLLDLDYGYELFPAFAGFTTSDNTRKQFNQEIRFVSAHGGPISWVIGGFYNRMTYRADGVERLPGFAEFAASPEGSAIYGGYYDGLIRPDGAEYVSFTDSKDEEMAAFGEVSYRPIEQWQITGGVRYFKYDTSITGGSDTPMTPGGRSRMPYPSLEIAESRIRSGEASDDGVVWKANTSYEITPDLMVYATYSTGYRIGGVNRVVPCITPLPPGQNLCALPHELEYGPDKVKNHELGVRATLLEGRVNTNLSVFRVDWDGIQLRSSTANGNIGITANGGKARSEGVDFSFNARLTPQLTLRGNYSYLDARLLTDVPDLLSINPAFNPDPSDPTPDRVDVYAGDRLPGSASNSGALAAIYTVPFGDDDLSFNWTATYTGSRLTRPGARGGGEELPGYMLHRASVTYRAVDGWEFSLFANNIFNKYAITGVSQDLTRYNQVNDGVIGRYYSRGVLQPRVVGIESRISF